MNINITHLYNKNNLDDLIKTIRYLIQNTNYKIRCTIKIYDNTETYMYSYMYFFTTILTIKSGHQSIKNITKLYEIIINFHNAFNNIAYTKKSCKATKSNPLKITNHLLNKLEKIINLRLNSQSSTSDNYTDFKSLYYLLNEKEVSINNIKISKIKYEGVCKTYTYILKIDIITHILEYFLRADDINNKKLLNKMFWIIQMLAYNDGLKKAIIRLQQTTLSKC